MDLSWWPAKYCSIITTINNQSYILLLSKFSSVRNNIPMLRLSEDPRQAQRPLQETARLYPPRTQQRFPQLSWYWDREALRSRGPQIHEQSRQHPAFLPIHNTKMWTIPCPELNELLRRRYQDRFQWTWRQMIQTAGNADLCDTEIVQTCPVPDFLVELFFNF
jgi:hypothetical protein